MDENKLDKLRKIKYSVKKCCGNCENGVFPSNEWGTCKVNLYSHKKHTGGAEGSLRNMSIIKFGYCSGHKFSDDFIASAMHYDEFVE